MRFKHGNSTSGHRFPRRWVFAVGLASVIVALLLAGGHALSLLARDHVIRALKETYASDLELRRFEVALFPRTAITNRAATVNSKLNRDREGADIPAPFAATLKIRDPHI